MRNGQRVILATATAAALLSATGCAVGTGGADDSDAEYSTDAELSGELSVMGFSGVDEVATSRLDYAQEQLGDVEGEARRGRPRHPAVPLRRRDR